MKLYFKPGACSLSSRITMTELGVPFDAIRVDTETSKTETGANFLEINPKGYVPALEVAPGTVITENAAILQYLADSYPTARLAPPSGTVARTRLHEWLSFTSSELHKAFSPYFSGRPLEGHEKERAEANLARRIGDVANGLTDGRSFILGETFSVADAYLFVVLNWTNFIGTNLDHWPDVARYVARLGARPAFRSALQAEGLIQDGAAA